MPPQPIVLYRRRWTQWFTVPFAALMAACTFVVVALDGLSQNPYKLQRALATFHKAPATLAKTHRST